MDSNVIPFPADRKTAATLSAHQVRPDIAAQLGRIFELIDEVEQLSEQRPISHFLSNANNLSSLVTRLRKPLSALTSSPTADLPDGESDPQPDIDNTLLERLYGIPPS